MEKLLQDILGMTLVLPVATFVLSVVVILLLLRYMAQFVEHLNEIVESKLIEKEKVDVSAFHPPRKLPDRPSQKEIESDETKLLHSEEKQSGFHPLQDEKRLKIKSFLDI
jgi:hypothetical protein